MSIGDFVVLFIIIIIFAFAVAKTVRRFKKGCTCSSGCGECDKCKNAANKYQ